MDDNRNYTVKSIADSWNISKSTVQRLVQSLDAEYLKQHTHTARNRTIIDAAMYDKLYQIYNNEPMQIESAEPNKSESLHHIESERIHELESELSQTQLILHQTELMLSQSESHLNQIEAMYKSQIDAKNKDIEYLKQQYDSVCIKYDAQLSNKDDQIKELHTLLDQQQQLHKAEQDQKQLLIEKSNDDSADAPERKGFFKRLFRK